jgi:hypothetical protein
MSAVSKIHRKNLITGIEKSKKCRKICVSSAVRLNVRMVSSPELASTLTCDILYLVNKFTAAVVTLTGIALSILIGKNSACCKKHRLRNDILGCDKLNITALSAEFSAARCANLRVKFLYSFKKHIHVLLGKY